MHICTKQKYKNKKRRSGLLSHTPHRLSEALGAYLRTNKKRALTNDSLLLNWGCTEVSGLSGYTTIWNHPDAVKNSVDKLATIRILIEKGINTLQFTSVKSYAKVVIEQGNWIVCRTLTRSSGGKGIVLAKTVDELVDAPLYTIYYKKNKEYRYHVAFGKVIDIQQKKRLSSSELEERGFTERHPSYIRNLENGYIFAREGVEEQVELSESSIEAVDALGLDMGSVDILANEDFTGLLLDYKICEVNSASGLTGSTFDKYVEAIEEAVNEEEVL